MKPYRITLRRLTEDEGGGWLAENPELDGCIADGETPEEALSRLAAAQDDWLAVAAEMGRSVPEPGYDEELSKSGKLSVRIPKSLHRMLARRAEDENISINALVQYLLAYGLGAFSEKKEEQPAKRDGLLPGKYKSSRPVPRG